MTEPHPRTVRSTGRSPLPAERLIATIVDAPLPDQFFDWLVLRGVQRVEDQVGPWRTPGQERVLRMTDGTVTQERLEHFDPATGWTNTLYGFTNVVQHILTRIDDVWRFEEDEHGTAVTWTWTFHAHPTAMGRLLMPTMGAALHRPYLQRILDRNLAWAATQEPVGELAARA